jgi:DNA-binding response OmpR family regulator
MRVLIVEDDQALVSTINHVLRREGHVVHCVSTIAECPSAITEFAPEAIILDLSLPDSRGLDTMEAMYGLVERTLPVIVFTGYPLWADKCIELGCDEYLLKGDFTPMDLPAALDRAKARNRLVIALDRHEAAKRGDLSWPGISQTDPGRVGDNLLSLAAELKAVAGG